MKTQVIMKRTLFGGDIAQQSKTGFFSATDLSKIGNKWRRANNLSDFNLAQFLKAKKTKEFMNELIVKYDKIISKSRGRGSGTWVHPLLFIDIALAINPRLKIEVYEWLFDSLLRYRNDSGDSYREMAAALWKIYPYKQQFSSFISETASNIKSAVCVKDWEYATEEQLEKRNKIHHAIKLLCNVLNNPHEAVRLGLKEYTGLIN